MDKKTMRQQFIILIIIIVGGVFFILRNISNDDGGIINVESNIDWQTIAETGENIDYTTGYTGLESGFIFLNSECKFDYLSGTKYKYINIFDDEKKSPKDFRDYKSYTNNFFISGYIEEAYLCIIASVVDWRKTPKYYYTTYILFNEPEYAGHIKVGYNKEKGILYDNTSWNSNKELNGRFRGYEAPKTYEENLKSIIVANREKGDYKIIKPLERLQKQGNIRIGGFVNAINQEGIMKKFVIIYKGGEINRTK